MSERLHRLAMKAFRGVPGELVVDFGEGQSMAVFGDNGTGKRSFATSFSRKARRRNQQLNRARGTVRRFDRKIKT